MPLYPLPWQDPESRMGQERQTLLFWLGSRLRTAQERHVQLMEHDPDGLLPGSAAVIKDMLTLKSELEAAGFKYSLPEHLAPHYDNDFAPLIKEP